MHLFHTHIHSTGPHCMQRRNQGRLGQDQSYSWPKTTNQSKENQNIPWSYHILQKIHPKLLRHKFLHQQAIEEICRVPMRQECNESFEILKIKLVEAPILRFSDWPWKFHVHVDVSNVVVDLVLSQPYDDMVDHPNVYASWKLNKVERNYLKIEWEALAMILSLEKFWHYLLGNPSIFFMIHEALNYLVNKPIHQGKICWWLLLFQEFKFEVVVRPGKKNVGPNHLYRLEIGEDSTVIENDIPDPHLFQFEASLKELEEIIIFLEGKDIEDLLANKRNILALKETPFTLMNGYFYKIGIDNILQRCALEHECKDIINEAHACLAGGHF